MIPLGILVECNPIRGVEAYYSVLSSSSSFNSDLSPCSMSSKKRKMSSKSNRANEKSSSAYDQDKFINESMTEKFGLIFANRSFIKEKGFQHPDNFFPQNHS